MFPLNMGLSCRFPPNPIHWHISPHGAMAIATRLPQQERVPAVAVDHQASEASARGLAGQQLPEEAAGTGPMGVT